MDVGQSTANALYQQATSGTFRLEEGAARRCAEVYTRFVDKTVEPALKTALRFERHEGFGALGSAVELAGGFDNKWSSMIDALTGMKVAALKMAAAYLRASKLIDESDDMNKRSIAATVRQGK
ncbi:hypothetical protein [Nocardia sp. NPDC051570]|uniref:hypothetical protein n=1 Tax=Nocardia sp. NPDC051570 TaxID=3364324 RepID=UPI0037AF8488